MKKAYYYSVNKRTLKFLIPQGKKILYYGLCDFSIVSLLNPVCLLCIHDEPAYIEKKRGDKFSFVYSPYALYEPVQKFDYIVLDRVLIKTEGIGKVFENIFSACDEHTRIIIRQQNHLWEPLLRLARFLGVGKKEKIKKGLSVSEVQAYLVSGGFEQTRTLRKTLFPFKLIYIGSFVNGLFTLIPLLDFLKFDQYIIARALIDSCSKVNQHQSSLTICLTVRDEEKNIEPIVRSLPILTKNQELLFVEGHSKDNTITEIKRMQLAFPEKNIRLVHQQGKGQGDAIRKGFNEARGKIIVLYEGDGTSEPADIQYVYECMQQGRLEFIEGNRFYYPLVADAIPWLNKMGNKLFARFFSLFLRQRVSDVLSGIKAIKKEDFKQIDLTWGQLGVEDPFGDFELLYGAARYGLKIGEIPIHYKPRMYGKSKTQVFKHGACLLNMALKGYWVFRTSTPKND